MSFTAYMDCCTGTIELDALFFTLSNALFISFCNLLNKLKDVLNDISTSNALSIKPLEAPAKSKELDNPVDNPVDNPLAAPAKSKEGDFLKLSNSILLTQ
jgi:hypothetical protein